MQNNTSRIQFSARTACGCQSDNISPSNNKVIGPDVSTRAEQCHHGPRVGIDTREVWPFVRVTAVTGKRQAAGIVCATVLPRYDVFDMERNERRRRLRHPAILTSITGTPSNNLPQTWVHV